MHVCINSHCININYEHIKFIIIILYIYRKFVLELLQGMDCLTVTVFNIFYIETVQTVQNVYLK